jgi:hypothetical protein
LARGEALGCDEVIDTGKQDGFDLVAILTPCRHPWLGHRVRFLTLTMALGLAAAGCSEDDVEAPSLDKLEASSVGVAADVSDASADGGETEPALPRPDLPIVDLGGVTTLPGPIAEGRPRVGVLRWVTRVRSKPSRQAKTLGYLRAGAVIEAVDAPVLPPSANCKKGWRAIQPAGYVCMSDVTDDLAHPVVRAISRSPDFSHRLPYMYGTVTRGGPVYARIPTEEHLKEFEPNLKKHLATWRDDEKNGARYGLDVWLRYRRQDAPPALDALEQRTTDEALPAFLKDGGLAPDVTRRRQSDDAVKIDQVDRRQGRSFIESFLFEGRRYNLTPDLTVIPADRFRPIRGSSFHGFRVDEELPLPFALVRRAGGKKYTWVASKKRMVEAGELSWRTAVRLTGKQRFFRDRLHYETEDGSWVDDRHASRIDPAKRWPKWAKQGAKWIDVNLTKQVLVAYEGQTMVYATLVSTGEAGLDDPDETTATTRGIFRIHTKHVTATMASDVVGEEFELRDVPYVQYFEGGYALHGAYWHDSFGRPKSHGCINLSPEDARRLFFWTEPQVPYGWHGAKKSLTGTVVFVHP